MGFFVFLVWAMLAWGVAALASSRGRSALGFFLLSFFFSPILGLIVVLVSKDLREEESRRIREKREHELQLEQIKAIATAGQAPSEGEKKCPYCAEMVKASAIKCKHCGSDISADRS